MSGTSILHNLAKPGAKPGEGVRWLGDPAAASRIVILNGHAEAWAARSGGGAFSVKWAPQGSVAYRCEGDTHLVRPDGLMLLNGGQPYEMTFRGAAETFCLFFSDDLVRQAWGGEAPAEFPNLIFRPRFAELMAGVRADLAAEPERWPVDLEARLLLVLDAAVAAARAHRGEARRLSAAKASTQRRLRARLEVARALVAEGEAANLDQVARAAGLSKFHLVRLFKAAFGTTPMKYAEALRLDAAAERLRASGALVDEIAYAVGYESPSAFGRAFRRRFGQAPSAWRRAHRN